MSYLECRYCGYKRVPEGARFCPICRALLWEAPSVSITDKIINYRDLIARSTEGFVGRQWVRDAVDGFLQAGGPRYFLLLGEPGSGKTTFMADLVRQRGYPHHFIGKGSQIGLAASLDWRDPIRFAESIGYQLLRDYGGWIMDWESWGIKVKQEVRDLQGLLVGAEIETFQALPRPADRPVLTVEQEVQRFGEVAGQVGVYIENFQIDAEQVVRQLLTVPLTRVAQRWPEHQVVIVVDGLDEAAGYSNPERNILRLLPNGTLPTNIRFLLSSRPGEHLSHDFLQQVQSFWLSEDAEGQQDPGTLKDARDYVVQLAQEETIREMLEEHELEGEVLGDEVAEASRGNFLYLYHYAQGLRGGDETLLDLKALPQGLNGIYQDFLAKIREKVGDVVYWDQYCKPVLGMLAVAREPILRKQIADFSGVGESTVGTILIQIRQFLEPVGPEEARHWGVYHPSFGEYLVSDRNPDIVSGREAHRRIVAHYRGKALAWAEVDWSKSDDYGLRHLPVHLSGAGEWERLRELMLEFDWLQAKLEATDVTSLIADYDLRPGDARAGEDSPLSLVQDVLRLAAHVLADNGQLAGQLLGRLLRSQDPKIQRLLDGAQQWRGAPWLRPLSACLTPPGPLLRVLTPYTHGEPVVAVAATPDGKRALSGAWDNALIVWDLETGRELAHLDVYPHEFTSIAVSRDGRRAASAGRDGTLRIWDLSKAGREGGVEEERVLSEVADGARIARSQDGQHAVSASPDGRIQVWDLERGTELASKPGAGSPALAVALWPGTAQIHSVLYEPRAWPRPLGVEVLTLRGFTDWCPGTVTADGRRALVPREDGTLELWDLETGGQVHLLAGHSLPIRDISTTRDGHRAVTASEDTTLRVWDLEGGTCLNTLKGHSDCVTSVDLLPDGRHAVSASFDERLMIWDLEKRAAPPENQRPGYGFLSIQWTEQGLLAFCRAEDHAIQVWDAEREEEVARLRGHGNTVYTTAVTTDGQRAISASIDGTLRWWNLELGTAINVLQGHEGQVDCVALTPDGRRAASVGFDRTLRVWAPESGILLRTLRLPEPESDLGPMLAITPDGRFVIYGPGEPFPLVWDLASEAEPALFEGHIKHVSALTATADGRYVVSGSYDKTLQVWEVQTRRVLHTFFHGGTVSAVSISRDGRYAVSADRWTGFDLRVWALQLGMQTAKPAEGTWHDRAGAEAGPIASFTADGPFASCALAPDGSTLAIAGGDGQVHTLRLEGFD